MDESASIVRRLERPRLLARKVGVEPVRGDVVAPDEPVDEFERDVRDEPERDVPVEVLRRVTLPEERGVIVVRDPDRDEGVRCEDEPRIDGVEPLERELPDEVEEPPLRVDVRGRDVGARVGERRRAGIRSPLDRLLPVLGVVWMPDPERLDGTRPRVEGVGVVVLRREPPSPEPE